MREFGSALGVADGVLIKTEPNINSTGVINMYLISTNTTLTEAHDGGTIEASGTITLTLTDANTLTSGWNVTVKNTGSGTITIARATGSDTMDDSASNITIDTKRAETYQVNNAADGFYTISTGHETSSVVEAGNDGQIVVGSAGATPAISLWVPRNYTEGLILTKDTDTTNDINITLGDCANSDNTYILKLTAEITKQIDAVWVAGDDAGGMFTGSVADSTTYYVHLIRKDSDGTIDAGFDISATAANIPTGYTAYRQIGKLFRNSSSANSNISYNIDANTETGEWTPTLQDTSFSDLESQTYIAQLGAFTKTDNKVFINGTLSISSLGSLTGGDNAYIAGLPYADGGSIDGTVVLNYAAGLAITAGNYVTGSITNSTVILLRVWSATTGGANLTITQVSADGALYFSGNYFTS